MATHQTWTGWGLGRDDQGGTEATRGRTEAEDRRNDHGVGEEGPAAGTDASEADTNGHGPWGWGDATGMNMGASLRGRRRGRRMTAGDEDSDAPETRTQMRRRELSSALALFRVFGRGRRGKRGEGVISPEN